jgi:hypothetical protein
VNTSGLIIDEEFWQSWGRIQSITLCSAQWSHVFGPAS